MSAQAAKALFLAPEPPDSYEVLGKRIRQAEQQAKTAAYALGDAWWHLIAKITSEYGVPVGTHVNAMPMPEMERIAGLIGYTAGTIRYYRACLASISLSDLHALIDETGSFSAAVWRLKGRSMSITNRADRSRQVQHKAWTRDLRAELGVTSAEAREMVDYYLATTTWEHISEVWDSREPGI